MDYPSLILKSGRDRAVLNRHPWVFSGAVKTHPKASLGGVVAVRNNAGELLAYGHYAPESTLICRLFYFGKQAQSIDEAFWQHKLEAAWAYRQQVLNLDETDGFRLVHAEGDGLPGVVIDLYAKAASVQLRTAGARAIMPVIQEFLEKTFQVEAIFLRTDKKEDGVGKWILGEAGERTFRENGREFFVDIEKGQKTGFFLDQRDNRNLLQRYAKGRKVLNAFAYSGAFSVFALQGDAKEVHSVDISASATELAQRNAALNFGDDSRHHAVKADCFKYLKDLEPGLFDLIILDPPAFTKHISTVKKAARGYKEINLKAIQKVASGGFIFTYSCSQHISRDLFRKIVFGAAADAKREVRVVCQMGQSPDHPADLFHPEGEYLKGLLLQVQ
ncbi:MAG TPA: class I SAM-dependent rRNA methyltransferase [Bacteroidetes bacterium]|nr:class I SAM-dependent rRNA methyltransferase [Bacteroidota bacterium]